jgi:tetratricopeptide (TPR) repeat protein
MPTKPQQKDQKRLSPPEYFRQVKVLLRAGKPEEALTLLQQSMAHFPNVPILLSYYGYLLVIVERKYRMGIELCQKAIEKHKNESFLDQETLYPIFYGNLGKAYAAAGKRKEALDALKKGLIYEQDSQNNEIAKELQRMGIRSKPAPIPFLDRSHPLNNYIGRMFYRKNNVSDAKKKEAMR